MYAMDHQDQVKDNHTQNQPSNNENTNPNSSSNAANGALYAKVMTDEQLETLRKQIAVYACICETLCDMHKNLSAHQDLAGVRMGNLYCDPLMTSTAHKITARLRWTPTPVQLQILERIFNQGNGIPSKQKIKEITTELRQHGRISEINVYNWFQNRRARSKRKLQNEAMNNAESKVETEVYSPKEMKTKPEIFLSQQNSVPRSEDLCFQSPEISSELHFADSHTKVEGIFPSDSDLRWRNLGQMSFFDGILSSAHGVRMGNLYCDPLMTSTAQKITARLRWTPTPVQLQILERIFNQGNGIPSKRKIKEITTELRQHGRISEINVYNWFQNRRARSKRKLQNEAMTNAESKVETEVYSPKEMKTKPEIFLSQQNSVPRSEDLCFQSPEISSELHFADSHTKVEGFFPSDSDRRWRNLGQMSFFDGILSSAHADTMEEMSTSRRMRKSPVNSDGVQESSYSGNSSNCSGLANICFCGFTCPVQISRNKKNLGRRFLSCPGCRGEVHCSFFKWVDLAMPDCAKEVIIELRDRLDQSTPSNAHVSINIDEVATAEGALATGLKVVKDKLACLRKNVKSDRKQMMLLSYSLVTSWVLFFLVALGVVVIMVDSKREKFVSSRLDHSH